MSKVKKLTDKEFWVLVFNEAFRLVGAELDAEEIFNKSKEAQGNWYEQYQFTEEQHEEWKQFFYDHFYEWQPKRVSKRQMKDEFGWWDLSWGFSIKKKEL